MLLRTVLDTVTGDLSDTRTRYLGSRPVKLFRISMQGSESVSVSSVFILSFVFNPLPHNSEFYQTLERSLLKTLDGKGEMLVTSISSISNLFSLHGKTDFGIAI